MRAWIAVCVAGLLAACGRIGYDAPASEGEVDRPDVTAGLIAHYSFDTELVADSSAGHDARCEDGCPTLAPNGYSGAALSMDGGRPHLRVPDDGSFDTPNGFTVAGWVNYRTIDGRTCIFTKPIDGSSNSWALCTHDNRQPFFFSCDECDFASSPNPVQIGVWVHLTGSYDGSTKRLYVDGVEVASVAGSATFSSAPLVIGGDIDGAFGFSTDGLIDELRLYDRALDPDEIALLAGI